MTTPYRDSGIACPVCKGGMREFEQRLVCDACDGILMTEADLAGGIEEMTSVLPTFAWDHERPGKRHCPRCMAPMTTCKIVLHLEGTTEHPRPELDRCTQHGVWFDREELAGVLATIISKGHGAKVVSKVIARHEGDPDLGRWSAMFPKFGGHGGF